MVLDFELSDADRFLCEVTRHREHLDHDAIRDLYFRLGDSRAYELCEQNGIASICADALRRIELPTIPPHWCDAHRQVERRITGYMAELDRVAASMSAKDIALVALKNSGIARALYPAWGACPMGDIDVLVRKADFRRAHAVLVDAGYVMQFRSSLEEGRFESGEASGGVEYSVTLGSGERLWFELQWRSVAGRWIRPDQEPPADELIDRSLAIEGTHARLLAPVDNLLQVALHTAKHTFVRAPGFRLHTDVDRIVRTCEIDWEEFVRRVTRSEVKTAVFFSLALAQRLLGTPVPDEVLARLSPGQWKVRLMSSWLERVGLFDPDGKKWSQGGYVIFVALLYDDWRGLLRHVFPKRTVMEDRYGARGLLGVASTRVARIVNLWKRRDLVK